MPFEDTTDGQTHSYNDGCGEKAHNKPHNPPAFPMHDSMGLVYEGQSLRDWFAGQALLHSSFSTINLSTNPDGTVFSWLAKAAYQMADAMLQERSKYE